MTCLLLTIDHPKKLIFFKKNNKNLQKDKFVTFCDRVVT